MPSDNSKWINPEPERVIKIDAPVMADTPVPVTGGTAWKGFGWERLKARLQDIFTAMAWGWILISGGLVIHFSYPFLHHSEFSNAAAELRARGLKAEASDLEEVGKVCRNDIGAPRACVLVYRHVHDSLKQPAIVSAGQPDPAMADKEGPQ